MYKTYYISHFCHEEVASGRRVPDAFFFNIRISRGVRHPYVKSRLTCCCDGIHSCGCKIRRKQNMNQIDKNIAVNLRRIRKAENMSLDMLADRTGVSKSMLGQIERGESNPTVSTIGKIVEGLKVPFEQLIYAREEAVIMPAWQNAPVYKEKEGCYSIRILLPYHMGREFEIYQGSVSPYRQMSSGPHGECTWEYLTVLAGEIELTIEEKSYTIRENESLYFASDCPHTYYNPCGRETVLSMIVTK